MGDVVSYYRDKVIEASRSPKSSESISGVEAVKIIEDFLDLHGETRDNYLFFSGFDWTLAKNEAGDLIVTRNNDNSLILRASKNNVSFFEPRELELEKFQKMLDYLSSDLTLQRLVKETIMSDNSQLEFS